MRLVRLTIDDFGLIARAVLEFADGLTICSGETGSGKTMLLGALRFALGERTETEMIRGGAARARVVLEVQPDDALRARLAETGFALAEDDDLIVTRELLATGRSQARVNGAAASASQLRALGAAIVDVIGQHDAQRLLTPAFALEIVDRFGGDALAQTRSGVRAVFRERQTIASDLAALRAADGRALAQLESARYSIVEIDAAAVEPDEDERLRERRDVLANAEKIVTALGLASAALEDERGAVDALGTAGAALGQIARYGERFAALASAIGALQSDISEIGSRLVRERETIEADPAELEAIGTRLAALGRLKKKYGGSLTAIDAARRGFAALLERDDSRGERIAGLAASLVALDAALAERTALLGQRRRVAAGELQALVAAELAALAMPSARFSVALEPLEQIGPDGAERAELRFAANAGEPERAVARSASGGELSRVLLAVIVVIADRLERAALVFDEIDAGIGGVTAAAVGTRLGRLARGTQVIVVTHLAQIASWADAHYALRKHDVRGATVIELETLGARQSRLEEIARMLSGQTNAVSLNHAETLVAGARLA